VTTPETPTCPVCDGPQMLDHPGGLLEIRHLIACPLLASEDATKSADYERADRRMALLRAATATELLLIEAFGWPPPDDQITRYDQDGIPVREPAVTVTYLTPGVRRRTWTPLTRTEPTTP